MVMDMTRKNAQALRGLPSERSVSVR